MDETLIHYTDVEIHQQELCVLSDVNLQLHKGEFVYLVGKVGSGKTSLLKTFYGELDVAWRSRSAWLPDDIHQTQAHSAVAAQAGHCLSGFPTSLDRTVNDNLEFVLRATGWKNKQEIRSASLRCSTLSGWRIRAINCLMNFRVASSNAS